MCLFVYVYMCMCVCEAGANTARSSSHCNDCFCFDAFRVCLHIAVTLCFGVLGCKTHGNGCMNVGDLGWGRTAPRNMLATAPDYTTGLPAATAPCTAPLPDLGSPQCTLHSTFARPRHRTHSSLQCTLHSTFAQHPAKQLCQTSPPHGQQPAKQPTRQPLQDFATSPPNT